MKENRFLIFLGVLAVALLGVFVWMGINLIVPVNPQYPYFPDTDTRLGGVHWNLGDFQPAYLYAFTSKGNYFIKVAYRDAKQRIKLMNVFAGKSGTDGIPFSTVEKVDESVAEIGSLREYGKYFKFGSRVRMVYLRNVYRIPGDSLTIEEPTSRNVKEACQGSKILCFSINYNPDYNEIFWNFPTTKVFPEKLFFTAISLSLNLTN